MNVDGRLAVIIGGSSGIGAATAQALARLSASLDAHEFDGQ
jgi:NAD(P)-dependent dehydrogenase (short-subunit alcohol dehydrogenase family)